MFLTPTSVTNMEKYQLAVTYPNRAHFLCSYYVYSTKKLTDKILPITNTTD